MGFNSGLKGLNFNVKFAVSFKLQIKSLKNFLRLHAWTTFPSQSSSAPLQIPGSNSNSHA